MSNTELCDICRTEVSLDEMNHQEQDGLAICNECLEAYNEDEREYATMGERCYQ